MPCHTVLPEPCAMQFKPSDERMNRQRSYVPIPLPSPPPIPILIRHLLASDRRRASSRSNHHRDIVQIVSRLCNRTVQVEHSSREECRSGRSACIETELKGDGGGCVGFRGAQVVGFDDCAEGLRVAFARSNAESGSNCQDLSQHCFLQSRLRVLSLFRRTTTSTTRTSQKKHSVLRTIVNGLDVVGRVESDGEGLAGSNG